MVHNKKTSKKRKSSKKKKTPTEKTISTQTEKSNGGGPKTEEGKEISSMNALTHGLAAKTVILPTENIREYEAFEKRMMKDLDPIGEFETEAARRYVQSSWRLRRFPPREAEIIAQITDPIEQNRQLTLLSRYERSVRRNMAEDIKALNDHKRNCIFYEIEQIKNERRARANGGHYDTEDLKSLSYRIMRETMTIEEMLKFLTMPDFPPHMEFVWSEDPSLVKQT